MPPLVFVRTGPRNYRSTDGRFLITPARGTGYSVVDLSYPPVFGPDGTGEPDLRRLVVDRSSGPLLRDAKALALSRRTSDPKGGV